MSNIADLIDAIAIVDEQILIRALGDVERAKLGDMVVWESRNRAGCMISQPFGGKTFCPPEGQRGVTIDTGNDVMDHEIKVVMLLMAYTGDREGGRPYKWASIPSPIRVLVKLGRYARARGVSSFHEFGSMPETKARTLLLGFIEGSKSDGGLNARVKSSLYKAARDGVKQLVAFGLARTRAFKEILDDLSTHGVNRHQVERRLRHSIIPMNVMKALIAEAMAYVDRAGAEYSEFAALFRRTNPVLEKSAIANPIYAINTGARDLSKALHARLEAYFRELPRHTYVLVLAFTGMRDSETGALRTGSAGHRVENGEDVYWISSQLSKTDDRAVTLDWVANEPAYRAVTLLSKINELYYERAHLILRHFQGRQSVGRRAKLEDGLSRRLLFGSLLTPGSVSFVRNTKTSDGFKSIRLDQYRIPVVAEDIAQLNRMECNYHSVAENSGMRGIPYREGELFNITAHQFRHTFAWFMIANRLADLDDIKYQFKHLRRAMTLIYAERGFKSFNELRHLLEHFEEFLNKQAINDIVASAASGTVAGAGGERLARLLADINVGQVKPTFGTDMQPHFSNVREIIAFTTRHSESIRGLPHGYCTKGPACKIKNGADPSHCLYCDTYVATPRHLRYWKAIHANCSTKLSRIDQMPEESQRRFQAFRQSLEDNRFAAEKIIARLEQPNTYTREVG